MVAWTAAALLRSWTVARDHRFGAGTNRSSNRCSSLLVVIGSSRREQSGRRNVDAGRPPLARLGEGLVAEWVHPRTDRQRVRDQHVQALDPVGHAAGGDAAITQIVDRVRRPRYDSCAAR